MGVGIMKKVFLGLSVFVLAIGLILSGCAGPFDGASSAGAGRSSADPTPGGVAASPGPNEKAVYLKGSGSSFKGDGWQNVFTVGGAAISQKSQIWHLVYTGEIENVTSMQVSFENGEAFTWVPADGFSVNGGGNNQGWILYAPVDWKISYVDSGNKNDSFSYVITKEKGNVNFNISGHNPGTSPDKPNQPKGKIIVGKDAIAKNGIILTVTEWREKGLQENINHYIEGFDLYKVNGDGKTLGEKLGRGQINGEGQVEFDGLADGLYAVMEVLTTAGEFYFEAPQARYFVIANSAQFGPPAIKDFDYDAFYKIKNGYGNGYALGYGKNNALLNNNGDIFPIGIVNAETGKEFASFCANAGSKNFAGESSHKCKGYLVTDRINRDKVEYVEFVKAYNYIERKYGDLNEYRPITQIVTWALLGAVDIKSDAFNNINWAKVGSGSGQIKGVPNAKAIVLDVMANYSSYIDTETRDNEIVDVVFMVCEKDEYDSSYETCQPQLVPIYGKRNYIITNKFTPLASLLVTGGAYQEYYEISEQDVYDLQKTAVKKQETWKIFERTVQKFYQGTTSQVFVPVFEMKTETHTGTLVAKASEAFDKNGHTVITMIKEDDKWIGYDTKDGSNIKDNHFEIADSSPKNKVVGHYFDIIADGNNFYLSFDCDPLFVSASVGAVGFVGGNVPTTQGDFRAPGHETVMAGGKVLVRNFTSKGPKDTPAFDISKEGNEAKLYIHFESITWYTSGEYEFVRWEPKGIETTVPELVDTKTSPFNQKGHEEGEPTFWKWDYDKILTDTVLTKELKTVDYDAEMYLTVTGPANEPVVVEELFSGSKSFAGLQMGTYTAVLFSPEYKARDGEEFEFTKTVDVGADGAAIDFGKFYAGATDDVITKEKELVNTVIMEEPKIIQVYNRFKDKYNTKNLEDVTLEPKDLGRVELGSKTDPYGEYAIRLIN